MVGGLLLLLTHTTGIKGVLADYHTAAENERRRGGGKGGGVTGFPPGNAPRDKEVEMLRRSSQRQTRVRDGRSLLQWREQRRLPLLVSIGGKRREWN